MTRYNRGAMACAIVTAAVVALAFGATSRSANAAAGACDNACLHKVMGNYLTHLLAHDPRGLPFAAAVQSRENAVAVALGEGVWKTLTRIRSSDVFADPVSGQVISYGAVEAKAGLGVLLVRLKLDDGKITESEILFNGSANAFSKPADLLEPDILYDSMVPADRRSSRAQLLAVAQKYLDGISRHDDSGVPFSYRCDRYASGAKVTNSPDHPATREGGSCGGSLRHLTGQIVVNRRFPVLDVERGVIWCYFIIPHDERATPGSTHVAELLKIVDGKIRSIEEFSFAGGFPPDSGFQADMETGTADTRREQNMHPSPEFLRQVLSGPPPVLSIDRAQTQTSGSSLTVRSTSIDGRGFFNLKNTGWGQSISPQVSWSAGPQATQSYVLIMEDGTAGVRGNGVLHWLAFNIPATVTQLPEGLPQMPQGLLMGANQAGQAAYTGPHAPAGAPVFHYHIQVFALDKQLELPGGTSRDAVLGAMQGHVLAKGQLVVQFQGPRV